MSKAIRLAVAVSEGAADGAIDLAPKGRACLLAAHGTGLAQSFSNAQTRLEQLLVDWQAVPEQAAGGPDEMVQGYRKADRRVILRLGVEPPPGTCKDVVQADCKIPKQRWQWRFQAAAFRER